MKSVEEDGYKNLRILEYEDLLLGHKKTFWRKNISGD